MSTEVTLALGKRHELTLIVPNDTPITLQYPTPAPERGITLSKVRDALTTLTQELKSMVSQNSAKLDAALTELAGLKADSAAAKERDAANRERDTANTAALAAATQKLTDITAEFEAMSAIVEALPGETSEAAAKIDALVAGLHEVRTDVQSIDVAPVTPEPTPEPTPEQPVTPTEPAPAETAPVEPSAEPTA